MDGAGALFGRAEVAVHEPLALSSSYTLEVVPGVLLRGSWPSDDALRTLWGRGVRTVVNLCAERRQDDDVHRAGMVPVNIPIIDNTVPTASQVRDFLSIVRGGAPVYVHCEAGVGRTGCMVAAFRVLVQRKPPAEALAEAEQRGLAMPCQREWILSLKPGAV